MAAKFKVGDKVVGNALADAHYNHTVQGWRGEVVKVWNGDSDCADDVAEWLLEFPYDDIVVRGRVDGQIQDFHVNSACFDLMEVKQETHVIAAAPQFKRILRSGDRLIVFWQDGTKTIVRRSADEPDSNYAAFTAALAIKLYGSNSRVKRILETNLEIQSSRLDETDGEITFSDSQTSELTDTLDGANPG